MTRATSIPDGLPRDLPSLTSLRAAAALLVFVFHVGRWSVLQIPGAGIGETGVAFFFVLSGFLLTWGYADRIEPRRFYVRRFARIWPAHAAIWVVAFLVPVTAYPRTWWTAAMNLPLLQAWVPTNETVFSQNGVSWSLSCEAAFYALFPAVLALLARRGLRTVTIVTVVAFGVEGAVAITGSIHGTPPWLGLAGFAFPLVRFPEFLLGIAAAAAVRQGWRPHPALTITAIAVCAVGYVFLHGRPADNVWLAPIYLAVIVTAAQRDLRQPASWLAARPLVYAGKVSFPFYLVHELVIINLHARLGGGPLIALLALVVAALAAVALHHLVEVPAHDLIVRALSSAGRTTRSDPASS